MKLSKVFFTSKTDITENLLEFVSVAAQEFASQPHMLCSFPALKRALTSKSDHIKVITMKKEVGPTAISKWRMIVTFELALYNIKFTSAGKVIVTSINLHHDPVERAYLEQQAFIIRMQQQIDAMQYIDF